MKDGTRLDLETALEEWRKHTTAKVFDPDNEGPRSGPICSCSCSR